MAEIMAEYHNIPLVTRIYLTGSLLTTALCSLELVSPYSLYLSWSAVLHKLQVWRLLTNFFFFGQRFSLDFVFHMFFLVRYCGALESGSYRSRPADFLYMLLLGASAMLLAAPLIRLNFLGSSLTFMLVYVWSRRNRFAQMNFLGLFVFSAPYLPWVLLSFSFVLGGHAAVDLLGIVVGHVYYFCEDVYPNMTEPSIRLLKTPTFLRLLFDRVRYVQVPQHLREEPHDDDHHHDHHD